MNLGENTLSRRFSMRGVTMTELVVVLAVMAILSAIAMPQYVAWRQNLVYREATRDIVMSLREARSKALSTNREHRVEIQSTAGMYRITCGNRSANSTNWSVVVRNWMPLPPAISIKASTKSIQLNTNGTATAGHIVILDSCAQEKYRVIVAPTGKIRVS